MQKSSTRVRCFQFATTVATTVLCGLMICAADVPRSPATAPSTQPAGPTTRPAPTTLPVQPPPEKHEPVALPPLPTSMPPAAAPVVKVPATLPVVSVPPTPIVVKPTTQPGPIDDEVAYIIGYSVGRRMRDRLQEDGRTANELMELKGVIDGLAGHDPAYSPQEIQAKLAEFEAYTQQHRAEKQYANSPDFRKLADDNLQKSRALLEQNAEMAGVEVRPDGVQVQELNPGSGRVVGNAKTLTVKNLRISLADGTLVKTTDGDQTEKIITADALPSVMDVVRGMRVGTKCRIWVPADKAYGLTGKPPEVGPNEAIEYEFELVGVE